MSRRGFTFIELMIVVFVIGILAAVGISKYQSFVVEARQKACMSQQKALDQAFSVWETKNTPIPLDDGAFQWLNPLNGTPVAGAAGEYRWRWDPSALAGVGAFVPHDSTTMECKSVLPQGSALARLVADEKLFACTELVKRAGGAEFIKVITPIPTQGNAAACNPTIKTGPDLSNIIYQFYKAPALGPAGTAWDTPVVSADHNIVARYVPSKIRRAIICHGYGMENSAAVGAPGTVGAAYGVNTTDTVPELLPFLNGAGSDGTREMLHQSYLLQ